MKYNFIRFSTIGKAICLVLFLFVGMQNATAQIATAQKTAVATFVSATDAQTLLLDEIGSITNTLSQDPQTEAAKSNYQYLTQKQLYYTLIYEAIVSGASVQNAITNALYRAFGSIKMATGGQSYGDSVSSQNLSIVDNPNADQAYSDAISLLTQ